MPNWRSPLASSSSVLLVLAGCASDPAAAPAVGHDAGGDVEGGGDARPEVGVDTGPVPDPVPPPARGDPLQLRFPIAAEDRDLIVPSPVLHVDRDPDGGSAVDCCNYANEGFPGCYGGHQGTDYLLADGFPTMDADSAVVVAGAGGRVVRVEDGNYDRCHGSLSLIDVSCDGHPVVANRVDIEHANGWVTAYLHLREGSAAVAEGDRVECGAPLGLVGSSGRSAPPRPVTDGQRQQAPAPPLGETARPTCAPGRRTT